jgi:hypothetical protein
MIEIQVIEFESIDVSILYFQHIYIYLFLIDIRAKPYIHTDAYKQKQTKNRIRHSY